ncbi:MAG: universal stress protein [Bacteroidia bacterium]|nr:universal stress protein [Bacteroidia bacterium]
MNNVIVVPVDFSDDSINALEYAIDLANKAGSDIVMVYVVKTSRFDFFKGVESVASKGDFENFQDKYQPSLKGRLSWEVRKGIVADEIIKLSEEQKSWIIVMGSHGVSGLMENWMGSNAFKVVSQSKCPVLTLRGDYKKREVEKIVLPIDNTWASRHKIPNAIDLAKLFHSEIVVLGTYPNNDKEEEFKVRKYVHQSQDVIHKHHVRSHAEYTSGANVAKLTIEFVNNYKADMVAIMTDTDEDISKMILGGYAQYMVHNCPVPLLSVHPNPDLTVKDYKGF